MKTYALALVALVLVLGRPSPAQTTAIQGAQRSVHSGIPTNAWTAVATGTTVKSVLVVNVSLSDYWVFVFDSTTNQLTNTRTNNCAYKAPANTATYWNPPDGELFRRGVVIMQSTTFPTLTNAPTTSNALVITVKHTP